MIEGSSVDPQVVAEVQALARGKRAIVVLDSNHAHAHVLAELRAYAPLVAVGSNPKTAVREFLKADPGFEIDLDLQAKLLLTVAPDGYLKRTR
jgi:cephalosporin hydroxylase